MNGLDRINKISGHEVYEHNALVSISSQFLVVKINLDFFFVGKITVYSGS